jgi:hypothetical protein
LTEVSIPQKTKDMTKETNGLRGDIRFCDLNHPPMSLPSREGKLWMPQGS